MNDEARRTLATITHAAPVHQWREQIVQSLISAATGGLVAWLVVWSSARDLDAPLPKLEVGALVVTDRLTVRAEGNDGDAMLVKDGSLFVKNRIVATQFLGAQIASSVMVANRQMTTPDDLFQVPASEWRFFTETGASNEHGGELLVRSRNAASSVAQNSDAGVLIRIGFDPNEMLQIVSFDQKQNASQPLFSQRTRTGRSGNNPNGTATDATAVAAGGDGGSISGTLPVIADANPRIASQFSPPIEAIPVKTLPAFPPLSPIAPTLESPTMVEPLPPLLLP